MTRVRRPACRNENTTLVHYLGNETAGSDTQDIMFSNQVVHGLQLQSRWRTPTAAVS